MDELIMNMNNIPIFALEGAAFAGKTTLLQYLKEHYSNQVSTIAEASEYVGGDKNFPDVPFKTYDDAKASTYYFIELEKQRCADALKAYRKNSKPILLDRTTPVSSLIFYSLLAHADTSNFELIDAFYQHALEAFQAQIEMGRIIIPGGLIYIYPDNRATFESRLKRGTKNRIFSSWESYKFLDKKYKELIKWHYEPDRVLILSSQNTLENLEDNAQKVVNFTNSAKSINIYNVFKNFLNENRKSILNVSVDEEKIFKSTAQHVRDLISLANKTI